MKTSLKTISGILVAVTAVVFTAHTIPASAATRIATSTHPNPFISSTTRTRAPAGMRVSSTTKQTALVDRQTSQVAKVEDLSVKGISNRIAALNEVAKAIAGMKNLSVTQKASFTAEITTLTSELNGLQAKIQADASSTPVGTRGALASSSVLRQDYQSITKDYRIYALVIPQVRILAAADRATTIISSYTTLSAKLQSRLATASAAGKNVSSQQAALVDLNSKIADATTQVAAAISAVSNLVPDNGNTAIAGTNEKAIKTGQAAITAAEKDIQAANKDAHTVLASVQTMPTAQASSTTAQ